jgi:UDP-glucuronate 4-epimerase
MKILITGYAGFVGHALSYRLLGEGYTVVGIDNFNNYYDPQLKNLRHNNLLEQAKRTGSIFNFHRKDIQDTIFINKLFSKNEFDLVINLAAQAGVRHSISHPTDYLNSNIIGFFNIIEASKNHGVKKIFYASTSGVYGPSENAEMLESATTDLPIQFYAATKKCNEVIAHSYSSMFGINTVGLRFFTVYGPWGRPDMALYKFTKAIKNGMGIELYNYGNHFRSFTYISDLIEMLFYLIKLYDSSKRKNYEIYNIGNPESIPITKIVDLISQKLEINVRSNRIEMQAGDVIKTAANIDKFRKEIYDFKDFTNISTGIDKFIEWYSVYEK